MSDEPSFYMSLPFTQREKLREKQKQRTYREFVKDLTSIDVNAQMDAESDYLVEENRLLYRRLTAGDTELLNITPDNYRALGEVALRLAERFHSDVTVMKYDDLICGYKYYQENPPVAKSNQIPIEVEKLIVDIALNNLTWGAPHIQHSLRNVGYLELKEHHVRSALNRNHIPIAKRRMKKGLSWRNFAKALKRSTDSGVIIK
jgi:hypothetical protein